MRTRAAIYLSIFSTFLFFSCKKEDPPAGQGNYTAGVFVVNEGSFGGTGTISWHNPATGETVQDVFGKANNGAALGEFVQSLTLHNDKAYIVVNGANKVYVVDAVTFKYLDTIGGLALPRFFLPLNNDLALISQWGANGLNGSVVKVDLQTLRAVQSIPTGKGPEKMIVQADGSVIVANSGGFGIDSTVSILNLGNSAEVDRKTVPGKNPGSLAIANFLTNPFGGGVTFVHCRGSYLDATPSGWAGPVSSLLGAGHSTAPYGDDLVAAPDGQRLYFAAGGQIYSLDANGVHALFSQTAYGLNCDPATGYLYCADARDFSSPGEVVIYKPNGEKVGTFPVGVAPGEVVFITD